MTKKSREENAALAEAQGNPEEKNCEQWLNDMARKHQIQEQRATAHLAFRNICATTDNRLARYFQTTAALRNK